MMELHNNEPIFLSTLLKQQGFPFLAQERFQVEVFFIYLKRVLVENQVH